MTENEKIAFEEKVRAKIAGENREKQRAYKADWREKNREHIRRYNKLYNIKKKLCREVEKDG